MDDLNLLIYNPPKCREEDTLEKVALLFQNDKVDSVPIVDQQDKVLGIITQKSLAQAILTGARLRTPIANFREEAIKKQKKEICRLLDLPMERVVIVDEKDRLIGVISPGQLFTTILHRESTIDELNVIINDNSSAIIAIDMDSRVFLFNKVAEKILNTPARNAIGRHIREISPRTPLPEILKTGEPQLGAKFEYKGRYYITNRNPIIRDGNMVGAVTIFQDVTRLQILSEELDQVKEYHQNVQNIMDNPYEAYVVVDSRGIITMFNKHISEFLNIPIENAVGKHVSEVIENTRMHIVVQTGKAEIGAIQHINGRDIVVMRLPIEQNGEITGALGRIMFKDITEMTTLANKISKLSSEVEYYKNVMKKYQGTSFTVQNIVGESMIMREVKQMAMKVARSNSTVLIRGESGTGKELFANAIYYESTRCNQPFIKVNCAAIPESLLESELFGYEEGAFTGAKKGGKLGKFELADKGTIFLDEIGDMPLTMQVKLLRVLQEKEVERIGSRRPVQVDVRVLAATNRPLEELMEKNLFRTDLYYRLNVVEIKIPPLRYRKDDIPEMVHFLLKKLCNAMGCLVPRVQGETMNYLIEYSWPGNIREMENVLEHCLNFVEGDLIETVHLPNYIRNHDVGVKAVSGQLREILEEAERIAIERALRQCQGNKIKASEMLGISRASIYQKIDKYQIQ